MVAVKPKLDHSDRGDAWRIGVRPRLDLEYERDLGDAVRYALAYPIAQVAYGVGAIVETLGQEPADPGGPKRMVVEFQNAFDGWAAWRLAMRDATWALVALLALDLVRAARLIASSRRSRLRGEAPRADSGT
jgi:hypothetical protein